MKVADNISSLASELQIDYKRHYILVVAFAFSLLMFALIFLFVHTVVIDD